MTVVNQGGKWYVQEIQAAAAGSQQAGGS
jgi:hypothetical protein